MQDGEEPGAAQTSGKEHATTSRPEDVAGHQNDKETASHSEQATADLDTGEEAATKEPGVQFFAAQAMTAATHSPEDGEFDHALVAQVMTMLTEGDKAVAIATAGAHRCMEKEHCLWMQEREDWQNCCASLKIAHESYARVIAFAKERECSSLIEDSSGGFFRQPGLDECQRLIDAVRVVAEVREEADRSGAEAQDICLDLASLPERWKPWEEALRAEDYAEDLDRARTLCYASLAAYDKAAALNGADEAGDYERKQATYDLRTMASRTPSGATAAGERALLSGRPVTRKMGRSYLERVVFRQLEQEEEKARHRMAGDAYCEDCEDAINGNVEGSKSSVFCARMFAEVDADGSGAIDADELRLALQSLNVYLSDQAVATMIADIDLDRNGTIEASEWEIGIVKAKYKVYMLLAMATRCADDAEREYAIAGAVDRRHAIFTLRQRIDRITPINERERMIGALWGIVVGDALGMPADGSVNLRARGRDYGYITEMRAPFEGPHADGGMHLGVNSELLHIGTEATQLRPRIILEPTHKSDIMGGKDILYSQRNIHPHRCLPAGCNTLSGQITNLLIQSLADKDAYDKEHFLELYVSHMLSQPDKDVHIDAVHIEFFERYARGNKAYYSAGLGSGASEAISFCLVNLTPLIVWLVLEEGERDHGMAVGSEEYAHERLRFSIEGSLADMVYQHVELFFRSEKLQKYAHNWATLLKRLLLGYEPVGELREAARRENMHLELLLDMPDEEVVGVVYNGSNWVDHSLPSALYLTIKYRDDPEAALKASANLGGDCASRTAMVGAMMGAMHGYTGMPLQWREGVRNSRSLGDLIHKVVHACMERRGREEDGSELGARLPPSEESPD